MDRRAIDAALVAVQRRRADRRRLLRTYPPDAYNQSGRRNVLVELADLDHAHAALAEELERLKSSTAVPSTDQPERTPQP